MEEHKEGYSMFRDNKWCVENKGEDKLPPSECFFPTGEIKKSIVFDNFDKCKRVNTKKVDKYDKEKFANEFFPPLSPETNGCFCVSYTVFKLNPLHKDILKYLVILANNAHTIYSNLNDWIMRIYTDFTIFIDDNFKESLKDELVTYEKIYDEYYYEVTQIWKYLYNHPNVEIYYVDCPFNYDNESLWNKSEKIYSPSYFRFYPLIDPTVCATVIRDADSLLTVNECYHLKKFILSDCLFAHTVFFRSRYFTEEDNIYYQPLRKMESLVKRYYDDETYPCYNLHIYKFKKDANIIKPWDMILEPLSGSVAFKGNVLNLDDAYYKANEIFDRVTRQYHKTNEKLQQTKINYEKAKKTFKKAKRAYGRARIMSKEKKMTKDKAKNIYKMVADTYDKAKREYDEALLSMHSYETNYGIDEIILCYVLKDLIKIKINEDEGKYLPEHFYGHENDYYYYYKVTEFSEFIRKIYKIPVMTNSGIPKNKEIIFNETTFDDSISDIVRHNLIQKELIEKPLNVVLYNIDKNNEKSIFSPFVIKNFMKNVLGITKYGDNMTNRNISYYRCLGDGKFILSKEETDSLIEYLLKRDTTGGYYEKYKKYKIKYLNMFI